MLDRFTPTARNVLVVAHEEAHLMRHDHIGTEHILVGLADEPAIAPLLAPYGLTRERARAEVVRAVGLGEGAAEGELQLTPAAQDALHGALNEAMRLGHESVEPAHLLLGVLRQRDGVARRVLGAAGAVPSEFREAVIKGLTERPATGDAIAVRLGETIVGDLGNPRTDARVLLAILERGGPLAAWLRERGVDDDDVRRMLD